MNAEILVTAGLFCAGAIIWSRRMRAAMPGRTRARRTNSGRMNATGGSVPVSIIVPARNEAHNLPALLRSIARLDPAPAEVIVVDDHSSDHTGDIARAAGATVVTPPPLPADWNGKPWACHAGAAVARGDYLLFTDADTVHAPDSLARALACAREQNADLVSVIPSHVIHSMWERLQSVFHLLLLVATGAGASRARGERRFSIGQYLLFRRDAYQRAGGHEAVRERIAEDLALARTIAERGGRVSTMYAPGLLRVRMYPEGFAAFVRGWRRSFHEGLAAAGLVASLEMVAVIGWLLGAPLLILTAAASHSAVGVVLGTVGYLAAIVAVGRRQGGIGAFGAYAAPLYPVFVLVFVLVSVLALCDRLVGAKVVWKGRRVISGEQS